MLGGYVHHGGVSMCAGVSPKTDASSVFPVAFAGKSFVTQKKTDCSLFSSLQSLHHPHHVGKPHDLIKQTATFLGSCVSQVVLRESTSLGPWVFAQKANPSMPASAMGDPFALAGAILFRQLGQHPVCVCKLIVDRWILRELLSVLVHLYVSMFPKVEGQSFRL